MRIFYNKTDKQLLEIRNNIFLEEGIPALKKNDFELDPFKTSWHGQYNSGIQGYIHQYSRLKKEKYLERIQVYILKNERWIQINLNIFELNPRLGVLSKLNKYEGIKLGMPPYSLTEMRLRNDDYKGPPLFHMLFLPEHKLGNYDNENSFNKKVLKLSRLIRKDMENIDSFIRRWHEMYTPNMIDWERKLVSQ